MNEGTEVEDIRLTGGPAHDTTVKVKPEVHSIELSVWGADDYTVAVYTRNESDKSDFSFRGYGSGTIQTTD